MEVQRQAGWLSFATASGIIRFTRCKLCSGQTSVPSHTREPLEAPSLNEYKVDLIQLDDRCIQIYIKY